jgi:protein SCO1/2
VDVRTSLLRVSAPPREHSRASTWTTLGATILPSMKTCALLCILLALPLFAADPPSASSRYFANLTLVDQDGNTVDLYSLMKGRTIVMHSFFTTCAASCPIMTRTVAAMQERFADRVGKDLVLVSITVDPANDTPAKLKAYAKGMNARSGWYFLTGTKEQVDAALQKIGQYTEGRDNHTNVIVIGNDRTGLWKKAFGLAKAPEVLTIVDSVLNDDGKQPAK